MSKHRFLFIFTSIILLDQISKYLAASLGLDVVINTGISSSFLASLPSIFITATLIIFAVGVYTLFRKDWHKHPVSSALFFGGAVSNILDRLIFGGVRDWLSLPVLNVSNNIADFAIFIGLILFIFSEVKEKNN